MRRSFCITSDVALSPLLRSRGDFAKGLLLAGVVVVLAACATKEAADKPVVADSPRAAFAPAGSSASASAPVASTTGAGSSAVLSLTSPAFKNGSAIPASFTCDGANHSPALSWSGASKEPVSYAVILADPDAPFGTFIHWVIYDIPGTTTSLPEGVPPSGMLPQLGGSVQGKSSFDAIGYGGPCPPPGAAHHYQFHLTALDAKLGLKPGATNEEVTAAMKGHEVGRAELVGLYARKK